MHLEDSIIDLDLAVDVTRLLVNPKRELLPVLTALKEWKTAKPQDISITQISGALTNLIYRCHFLPTKKYVLARIFGTSGALFDRSEEQSIFAAVAHAGLGPKLLANFRNGRLEEFLLDQSITAVQMRTEPVAACIAAAMAMFNFTQLTQLPQAKSAPLLCWLRLRSWAEAVEKLYTPAELQQEGLADIFAEIDGLQAGLERKGLGWIGFCHNDIQYGNMLLHTASCDLVDTRIDAADPLAACLSLAEQNCSAPMTGTESGALPSEPTTSKGRPAFSIEDGQDAWAYEKPDDLDETAGGSPRKHPRGLTFFAAPQQETEHGLEDSEQPSAEPRLSIRLIDYEYAGANPVAYDIANHWCEYGANYHAQEPHVLDYSKFPSGEQQLRFTRAYAAALLALNCAQQEKELPTQVHPLMHSLAATAATGAQVTKEANGTDIDVIAEQLRELALDFVPVSHLQWGIWGLLQARLSEVPSFNFKDYGRQRLQQWRLLRPKF